MNCELCPRKAIIPERRGSYIRYMCGECYALSDEEFHKKEARMKERKTKQRESEGSCILNVKKKDNRYTGVIPESQLALF